MKQDVWHLHQRALAALKRRIRPIAAAVRRAALGRRWLSHAYYLIFNDAIDRELLAVVAGLDRFERSSNMGNNLSLLRRNVHRLEKGILMRPRREVFALEYIEETVSTYVAIAADGKLRLQHSDMLSWAYGVLSEYFELTNGQPEVASFESTFQKVSFETELDEDRELAPYRRIDRSDSIEFEDLLALAQWRRSVRWFRQIPVPRSMIEKAVSVAGLSPSACNRQPFKFYVFDDQEEATSVTALAPGSAGYSQNVPAVAVIVGQLRNYFDERDRHLIYIDGALAAMSFVYALETLGLSSCLINWPDIADSERAMKQTLALDPDERPVMLVAFGYPDPDGLVAASVKKPVNQLVQYGPNMSR